MNQVEPFDNSTCADRIHLAERELASFVAAVRELFGQEQALLSANDWLNEYELMDTPPRSTSLDWRVITVAASARLANRLSIARDQWALGAPAAKNVSPIPSSNGFAFAFLL